MHSSVPVAFLTGTWPNITRNAIVNCAEMVTYDIIKEKLLDSHLFTGESGSGNRSGYHPGASGTPKRKREEQCPVQGCNEERGLGKIRALGSRASTRLSVSVTVTCLLTSISSKKKKMVCGFLTQSC